MVALALYLGWLSGSHAYRHLFPSRASVRRTFEALLVEAAPNT